MIRGEPEEPGSYFGIGNARNFLRSIGVMLAWLPCVAVFVCCSVWFIVLIDSSHVGEYTTITYLMIALAVVFGLVPASTITGFFGIALFFMIDNDDSWGRGVANAWKFGKNNLVSITLHSLAIPVLIVFLSTVFCFGLFVFAGVFPCLYLNLGMLYIGITGQKHCKSPIEDEPDEW